MSVFHFVVAITFYDHKTYEESLLNEFQCQKPPFRFRVMSNKMIVIYHNTRVQFCSP